jgi:hypothetical protein
MLTSLYPLLDALTNGRVIRRAVAWFLTVAAWLVLAGGVTGAILIVKTAFGPTIPNEATIGGLLWAIVFLGIVFALFQIYRYHVREIDRLGDTRFVITPIVAVLLRLLGEQFAVWCAGFGLGGLILGLLAPAYAPLLAGSVAVMPGAPVITGVGALGAISFFASSLAVGFVGLIALYFVSEALGVAADASNQLRRLVALHEHAMAMVNPSGPTPIMPHLIGTAITPQPVQRPRVCPHCHAPVVSPTAPACDRCGRSLLSS